MATDAGDSGCTHGLSKDIFDAWTGDSRNGFVSSPTSTQLGMIRACCWAIAQKVAPAIDAAGGGSLPTFVENETPSGTVNGSNATFGLAHTPAGLQLYVNGVLQNLGVNFTLSGATITFLSGYIPLTGDTLLAFYRY